MESPTEDLFGGLTSVLSEHLSPVVYGSGCTIFEEGEASGCAYVIEHGSVRISRTVGGKEVELKVLGPGELFGEMSPIDQQQRSASATAIEETELIPISPEQIQQIVSQAHPLVHLLLRVLLDRLRATHERILTRTVESVPASFAITDEIYEAARNRAVERLRLERALREAIRRREFGLVYQPIVSLSERRVVGFEALIRWLSSDWGQMSPGDFIGVAEETGLIVPIGLWALEHACHYLVRFQTRFHKSFPNAPPLFMSVNVSGRQLRDFIDVENLMAVINTLGLDPAQVKLEITEGVLMENPDVARLALQKLKSLGVSLAVDDFGTGYSSLSYLQRFQLDVLKIDRSFVTTMLVDGGSDQIVRAVLGLAQSLNMEIVAEGVEKEEEAARLRELGCDLAQGYLFSRPVPAERIMELLGTRLPWQDRE